MKIEIVYATRHDCEPPVTKVFDRISTAIRWAAMYQRQGWKDVWIEAATLTTEDPDTDLAHEADMRALYREQLRADCGEPDGRY